MLGNRTASDMVWGNSSGIVSGGAIDRGIPLIKESGAVSMKLNANETVYVACSATRQLDYTILQIIN